MDLWMFLTAAVIVGGIVEMVKARSKNKFLKQLESGEDDRKKYGEKIDRLERRVANLEAIVVDVDAGKAVSGSGLQGFKGSGNEAEHHHQPGTMTNKLK